MDKTRNTGLEVIRSPGPREGLWYGRVLLVNHVIHTVIADSLDLQPERLVKFATSNLPTEIVEILEPDQQFWLDLTAARELRAVSLDARFFGILPPV